MQLSGLARRAETLNASSPDRVGRLQFVKTKHAHRAIKLDRVKVYQLARSVPRNNITL